MNDVQDNGAALVDYLNCLISALELRRAGAPNLEDRHSAVADKWEDSNYFYVEANIPGATESDIDISIHSGIAFIRIVR
jgi:HSP20 family molecular chaperone IbpA